MSQKVTVCTLVYLLQAGKIGYARPKGGPCRGKLSSYGGKKEDDETILGCAVRETEDESGGVIIRKEHLQKRGTMLFLWDIVVPGLSRPKSKAVLCHMFACEYWEGVPRETGEMGLLEFHDKAAPPYSEMMPGEEYWHSKFIAGELFTGVHCYSVDVNGQVVLRKSRIHSQPKQRWLAKQ